MFLLVFFHDAIMMYNTIYMYTKLKTISILFCSIIICRHKHVRTLFNTHCLMFGFNVVLLLTLLVIFGTNRDREADTEKPGIMLTYLFR